jgi:hypothetical protein
MAAHILILASAEDPTAAVLAATLRERGATADVEDAEQLVGPAARVTAVAGSAAHSTAGKFAADAGHVLGARVPALRRAGAAALERAAGGRLQAYLHEHPADVVVSTAALATELLGRMRDAGSLSTPVVSAITDLAGLGLRVHPGVDLHLISHPESKAEVLDIAGPHARVEAVHGLTDLGFTTPPERLAARAELELPSRGWLVVVSGGSRGVGDVPTAVQAALHYGANVVVVLAGHNAALRERLQQAYAGDERVQVWGYSDRMVTLLAAADVVIHSTAGLTILEALMCGCRVISFGWSHGRVRANERAYEELGIAAVAKDRRRLAHAIVDAIAAPRSGPQVPDLPRAADLVLELAGREAAHAG